MPEFIYQPFIYESVLFWLGMLAGIIVMSRGKE